MVPVPSRHRAKAVTDPIRILVDADACPVKAEVYRVAERYGLEVLVVTNGGVLVPRAPRIRLVIVGDGFDAADDWIAERAGPADIVVTADIPLADRCLKADATVIGPTGRPFTKDSIGMALASRALMADLRAMGTVGGGNKPMSAKDKSAFLSALDAAVVKLRRGRPG
jgi:uncharacterized protein YaiI (UPF0178 family)